MVLALHVLLVLGPQLTQQLHAHLALMVLPPLLLQLLLTVVILPVLVKILDVSPALTLLPPHVTNALQVIT